MNKYLHTLASVGFLFTLNYDARNHEIKKKKLKCVLMNGLFWCGADCYVSMPGRMAGRPIRSEEASVSLRSCRLFDQSGTACMHHRVIYMRTIS